MIPLTSLFLFFHYCLNFITREKKFWNPEIELFWPLLQFNPLSLFVKLIFQGEETILTTCARPNIHFYRYVYKGGTKM